VAPAARWGRWVLVLLAVVALHWVAVRWVDRHKSVSNPAPTERAPVQVELLTPKPVAQAPSPAPKPAPAQPKPKPVATVRREEQSLQIAQAQVPARAQAQALQAVQAAQAEQAAQQAAQAAQAAAAQAAAAKAASEAAAAQAAAAAAAAPGDKFNVPPSGELRYDTLVNGVMNQVGNIHWTNDGQHFQMIVSIPLPFVGPFVYSSKGHIDRFGLAPEQYSEQRGRHAADVTIFNRETRQLVYTRTPNSQPLADGAQDRFSVVMQLASLVRGSPDTYKPGVVRQFNVADNDSAEIWPIETVGDENVQTPDGNVQARHFTRLPRREGDRRKLDFWLSPALGWLPVRILQTEPNGMQIEMLWSGKLQPPAPPGTPDATHVSAPDASQPEKP
jgi:hypothetical protein